MLTAMEHWTARECAARVQEGQCRAEAVASHFIARVQRLNPALNALVQFDAEAVLAEARGVDSRLAAGEALPMAGVPVTIKDNLWVAGRTITQGSRLFADFRAPRDACSGCSSVADPHEWALTRHRAARTPRFRAPRVLWLQLGGRYTGTSGPSRDTALLAPAITTRCRIRNPALSGYNHLGIPA